MAEADTILELRGITRRFGGLIAVHDVNLSIRRGEIVGLIGPNGAGKTTLVNVITGVHPASAGAILHDGKNVTRHRPYQAARAGLARTFQIVQPFPDMSVLDNVAAAALFSRNEGGPARARVSAWEQLEIVGLTGMAGQDASSLTLAMRKRLELAKALAMKPRLLLCDEVMAGLNHVEIEEVIAVIRKVRAQGISVLVIEHVIKAIRSLSDRLLVLHHGELIADGAPEKVLADATVVQAYLGARRT